MKLILFHINNSFFLVLAECGDFNPEVHNADFVSEFRFSPSQTEVMEMDILRNFMTLMYVCRKDDLG